MYSSGAWDQAAGTIENDAQVRRYEAIGEDYADGTTFHLLRNNHWVVDSRIPALGAEPNDVPRRSGRGPDDGVSSLNQHDGG